MCRSTRQIDVAVRENHLPTTYLCASSPKKHVCFSADRLYQKFPGGVPKDSILFTVDVANLYGNIPIDEAIESTVKLIAKNKESVDLLGLDLDTIKRLLSHCLTNNYVRFGQRFYKQNHGIAMGSRIAPSPPPHWLSFSWMRWRV